MIATQQYLRHTIAPVLAGPRILSTLQQVPVDPRKRIPRRTLFVSQDPGQEANDRIDDHHRGHFTAVEHVIADGDLFGRQDVSDPFVKAFVTTTQ